MYNFIQVAYKSQWVMFITTGSINHVFLKSWCVLFRASLTFCRCNSALNHIFLFIIDLFFMISPTQGKFSFKNCSDVFGDVRVINCKYIVKIALRSIKLIYSIRLRRSNKPAFKGTPLVVMGISTTSP